MNGDEIIDTDAAEPTEELTGSLDAIIAGNADSINVDDKGGVTPTNTENDDGKSVEAGDDFIDQNANPEGDKNDEGETPDASAAAKTNEKGEETTEGRSRLYLNHLPEHRRELIRILAENPDMSEEQAIAKLKGKETTEGDGSSEALSYDELPTSEKITVDEARLKEISAQLLEKDELMVRDDEWKKLYQENQELVSRIASNKAIAAVEQTRTTEKRASIEQQENEFLDKLEADYPDLKDESTDLWAAVAGRAQQINNMIQQGKPLPAGFDASDVFALRRQIVEEQHQRLTGKAPEAKPGAQGAKQADEGGAKKRPIPGSAGRAAAQARPVIGQDAVNPTVKLAQAKTVDEYVQGLNAIIKGGAVEASDDDDVFVGGRRFELVS